MLLWCRRFLNSVPKGTHIEGAGISKIEFHVFLRVGFALLHHLITEDAEDSGSEQQNVSTKQIQRFFSSSLSLIPLEGLKNSWK